MKRAAKWTRICNPRLAVCSADSNCQGYCKDPVTRFAEPMSRLIAELKKLPGIGTKNAQRLAFHILRSSEDDAEALASAVRDVKAKLRLCTICNNITDV